MKVLLFGELQNGLSNGIREGIMSLENVEMVRSVDEFRHYISENASLCMTIIFDATNIDKDKVLVIETVLRLSPPASQVLGIFDHLALSILPNLLSRGLKGVLCNRMTAVELRQAVRIVWRESQYIYPHMPITPSLDNSYHNEIYFVSKREKQVMEFLMDGKSNREIADVLDITEGTVKVHLKHVYKKFNVCRRSQLISKLIDFKFSGMDLLKQAI